MTLDEMRRRATAYFNRKTLEVFPDLEQRRKFELFLHSQRRSSPYACEVERTFWDLPEDMSLGIESAYFLHIQNKWNETITVYTRRRLLGEIK